MNKFMTKASLLAPLAFFALPGQSATSLSIAGVGNFADARLPEQVRDGSGVTIDEDDKFGYGAAVLLSNQGDTPVGLETGAIVVNRKFRYGSSNYNFTQSQLTLQIPLLIRANLGQFFSVGAGPYLSLPIGGVKNTFTVGGSTSAPFEVARDVVEVGLQGAVSVGLPVSAATAVFAEGRYTYGLAALNADSDEYSKTNDLAALLGIRITL